MIHVEDDHGTLVEVFEAERSRLVGLAYRITGSRADAEDVVQDAWLRVDQAARRVELGAEPIERPAAWLTTVTSRLALDRLRSAHHRRETYVGPWLPEPVAVDDDPAAKAELVESLTVGFLAVLERLGPVERVVFLLADVFAVPYDEIATVVEKSPQACRQIASRARRRVREDRPRYSPTDERAWNVAATFLLAAQAGDIDTLVAMLADDATLVSDGGPHHHAARRPIVTPQRIARLLSNLTARMDRQPGLEIDLHPVNGQPGVVVHRSGQPYLAVAVEVVADQVSRLWIVVNPEKLQSLDTEPVR